MSRRCLKNTKKNTYNTTNNQRRLENVLKTENSHAQVGEHTRFRHERERAKYLLHGDSCHRRQIKVGVVRHDQTGEQNRHYAGELERFSEHIRRIHEYEHEGGFE